MNWLKNLKIAQKILALSGVMLLIIGLLSFIGLNLINTTDSQFDDMYAGSLLPVKYVNEIRALGSENEALLLRLILSRNLSEVQSISKEMKDIDIENDKINQKLRKEATLNKNENNKLIELNKIQDEFASISQRVSKLNSNGDKKAAYQLYLNFTSKLDNYDKALSDIAVKMTANAAKLKEDQDKNASTTRIIIILVIITSIGAAISLSLFIANMISKPVSEVVANLKEVANGNLTVKDIDIDSQDETGILAQSLNTTVATLKRLVAEVAHSAEDILSSSKEMSESSEQAAQGAQQAATSTAQLAQGAQQISSNIIQLNSGTQQISNSITQLAQGTQQIVTSTAQLAIGTQEISRNVEQGSVNINNMNKAIHEVSDEAKVVAQLGNDTEVNANAGAEYVKKAVNKIDSIKKVSEDISVNISELGKLSSEIEQIVDLIKNIAGQTNLLALNAAIEAARAGEHGKGFAVVADEVKKLAGQSAHATEKITAMIKEIQNKTNFAVTTMDKATHEVEEGVFVISDVGKALENIINQVKNANQKIQGITKEINGVAKNSEEMVQMIENISAITEQTAASAEEISSITQQAAANTEEISSITQQTAASAEEISNITEQTAANAEEISSIAEEQTANMEEISASSQSLANIAEKLTNQVSMFKI